MKRFPAVELFLLDNRYRLDFFGPDVPVFGFPNQGLPLVRTGRRRVRMALTSTA